MLSIGLDGSRVFQDSEFHSQTGHARWTTWESAGTVTCVVVQSDCVLHSPPPRWTIPTHVESVYNINLRRQRSLGAYTDGIASLTDLVGGEMVEII